MYRFLVPLLAPFALLLQESFGTAVRRDVGERTGAGQVAAAITIVVLATASSLVGQQVGQVRLDGNLDRSRVELGR